MRKLLYALFACCAPTKLSKTTSFDDIPDLDEGSCVSSHGTIDPRVEFPGCYGDEEEDGFTDGAVVRNRSFEEEVTSADNVTSSEQGDDIAKSVKDDDKTFSYDEPCSSAAIGFIEEERTEETESEEKTESEDNKTTQDTTSPDSVSYHELSAEQPTKQPSEQVGCETEPAPGHPAPGHPASPKINGVKKREISSPGRLRGQVKRVLSALSVYSESSSDWSSSDLEDDFLFSEEGVNEKVYTETLKH